MQLFGLNASRPFAEAVAARLGQALAEHVEREFEDGEHKARPLAGVRGEDVYVIQSLYSDATQSVNDKLCRLLFFLAAVRDDGARRVTAVIPYLGYARKDRRTQPHDPVTSRYIAQLLEAVGTDRVVALDVHNRAAFDNAFRCPVQHLEARSLFESYLRERVSDEPVVVLSPDVGGVKRARQLRDSLQESLGREVGLGFMEKQRALGVVSGETLVGDVAGGTVLVIDDLVSTGGTLMRAVNACVEAGARRIFAAATHGLFVGDAGEVLDQDALERLVITDSVPPFRLDPDFCRRKLDILSVAPLFADTVRELQKG